jgi:hypothetical protein
LILLETYGRTMNATFKFRKSENCFQVQHSICYNITQLFLVETVYTD